MICRLLAASGYNEEELIEFVKQVEVAGPASFLSTISKFRRLDISQRALRVSTDTPAAQSKTSSINTAVKIQKLLMGDAAMSKADAMEALANEVKAHFPSQYIPPKSRQVFLAWIRQLAKAIPEKDLLFFAMIIRNRVVHDAPGDWRLK